MTASGRSSQAGVGQQRVGWARLERDLIALKLSPRVPLKSPSLASRCSFCRPLKSLARGLKPSHSITSSARARKLLGSSRFSAWAVRPLMTRRNRVGCWTGRSAGLAPRRILSTSEAA
jgi:hypothetical protein